MYEIYKSPLFKLSSRKKFLEILELKITYAALRNLVKNSDSKYREFPIKKINSKNEVKIRDIKQPSEQLLVIHKKLARLLSRVLTPDYLKSKKGYSYKDNALEHIKSDYVYTIDIKDFFPSCSRDRIAKSLTKHFEIAGDVAYIISKLLTFKEYIPQGGNTSNALSFWSNYSMFEEINNYCQQNGLIFTLFVDDITISANHEIDHRHYKHITFILKKNKFSVKHSKTKYFKKNSAKHITGIAIAEHQINIENKKRKDFFSELNKKEKNRKDMLSLSGKYNSLKYIDPSFCKTLSKELKMQKFQLKKKKKVK